MQLLIKNVRIVLPSSGWHGRQVDIFLENGILTLVEPVLELPCENTFDAKGAYLSAGFVDVGTTVGDPGFEHREDFESVTAAAAAGGYTAIACLPNTNPAIHSKPEVKYIRNQARNNLVDILPIGAVSVDCAGKDIAELYDMQAAGAVAFSDGKKQIQSSALMLRALLYVQPFNGVILNQPLDANMARGGQMHEGKTSTSMGLRGIPALAEELMVQRDLYLAEYTNSRLHLLNISCKRSVELVRKAKAAGLKLTASVPAMNLACTDLDLENFDVNYKVMPPLRSEEDREALKAGLLDGTIDFITSNHTPLDPESKDLEFPFAEFGATGLETAFSLVAQSFPKANPDFLVEKLSLAPRRLLGLPMPGLEPGDEADFTIFSPTENWTLHRGNIRSKSKNTPFVDQTLTGKVLAVIRRNHFNFYR